ncbi:MAG: hypothetical protein IJH84_04220, partial [Saccharopolyspora sp.]|uniref:hypothetical protein n=1 Tax=Saccharopolyspora sp. TaxID=33915 RepID=UPI0025F1870D
VFQQVAPLLLGEGLYLPVYAKEFAHDYVSMIRLSMDFDNVRDGDPLQVGARDDEANGDPAADNGSRTGDTADTDGKADTDGTPATGSSKKGRVHTIQKTTEKIGAKTSQSTSWSAIGGFQTRFYSALGGGLNVLFGGYRTDFTRSHRQDYESSKQTVAEGKRAAGSLQANGKVDPQPLREFRADFHLRAEVLSYVRPSEGLRRILPQRPGRDVPKFQALTAGLPLDLPPEQHGRHRKLANPAAPITSTVDARFVVPESLVSRGRLGDAGDVPHSEQAARGTEESPQPERPGQSEHPGQPEQVGDRTGGSQRADADSPEPVIQQLGDPPPLSELPAGATRNLDYARLVGFQGGEVLGKMAQDLLKRVTNDDPIVRFPVPEIVRPVQAMLNPRRIEADPQRFSRPRTAELSYQRTRANLHVSMATTLKPVLDDSAPVTRSEYELMSRELTARNKVGHARGWNVTSAGFVGSVFLGYLGGSQHDGHLAQGQGIGVVNTSPYSTSRG